MSILHTINARELKNSMDELKIIDIRTKGEWHTGVIKNSYFLTFFNEQGQYDLSNWLDAFEKIVPSKQTKFVLVCAHAHRTQMLGEYLSTQLNYTQCFHLQGGVASWMQEVNELMPYTEPKFRIHP